MELPESSDGDSVRSGLQSEVSCRRDCSDEAADDGGSSSFDPRNIACSPAEVIVGGYVELTTGDVCQVFQCGEWPIGVHVAGCGDQFVEQDDVVFSAPAMPAAYSQKAECQQQ